MNIWANEDIEKILLQLNELNLPFKNYSFSEEDGELIQLGKGGVGYVYEAEKKSKSPKRYAIKINGFRDKTVSSEFFNTSMSLQKSMAISNENIIPIHEYAELLVWLDDDNNVLHAEKKSETEKEGALCLQFVLMEKESPVISENTIKRKQISCKRLQKYKEEEVLQLATDIGHVLLDAHKNNVLHKDVKLENIFYSEKNKKYMLGDFGIAEEVKDGTSTVFSGTEGYAAPEVLALKWRHDATADIYSLGMVLYLAMNDFHFPESDKQFKVNSKIQYEEGYIPSRPKHGSDALWMIVEKMLMYDADDRYQYMEAALDEIKQLIYEEKAYAKLHLRKSYGIMGAILLFFGIWISKEGVNIPLELTEIRWIKITLYSLAGVMLLYGFVLTGIWDTPHVKEGYTRGTVWHMIILDYAAIVLLGVVSSVSMDKIIILTGRNAFFDFIYNITRIVVEYDFFKIGAAGMLFCIAWTIREKVLLFCKKIMIS